MNRKLLNLIQTQKGLALVSVLAMVTLATVIILALFSVSDSEFKASKVYAGGNAARQLADSAVNIVIGQIRSATYSPSLSGTTPTTWASQPGAIRVYQTNGVFQRGHKLYSDAQMIVTTTGVGGESAMGKDAPPSNWNENPDQYVDLNEPVVRVSGNTTNTYFPVVDPRAASDQSNTTEVERVEGFMYSATPPTGGGTINGVKEPTGSDPNDFRLPMPVEWVYVLQDGTVGTVTNAGQWTGGDAPTADNQIIGRVAFWTDDESCKLNINTASEPGYWAVPTFFHERDKGWSDCPPSNHEYQRFPGHPATVSLSTVLYPGPVVSGTQVPRYLDSYPYVTNLLPSGASTNPSLALAIKQRIYEIVPKLQGGWDANGKPLGGSMDGLLAYPTNRTDGKRGDDVIEFEASGVLLKNSRKERLYASLDELLFSEKMTASKREENDFKVSAQAVTPGAPVTPSGQITLLGPATLEKSRFFLTAHSRAPELNLFGRPRVAMWPIPDASLDPGQTSKKYRTGFDDAIAMVATLSDNPSSTNTYYFSRKNADSSLQDIGHDAGGAAGLRRNLNLMDYLDKLLDQPFPGYPAGRSFRQKYGSGSGGYDDSRQILVEIFDYIRCTNLYDSFLAPKFVVNEGGQPNTSSEMPTGMDYRWEASPPNTLPNGKGSTEVEPGRSSDIYKIDEQMNHERADEINKQKLYYTYTEPRFKVTKFGWDRTKTDYDLPNEVVPSGVYPGHGQVTPAEWQVGGKKYKGFGRFPTISEVGLHFICTADGLNDDGSYKIKSNQKISGGRTAEKIDWDTENARVAENWQDPNTNQNAKPYWYSNYPPFPSNATIQSYGCTFKAAYPRGDDTNPRNHPGCNPANWNATLDRDKPLTEQQKRVQVALQIEMFVPSLGFTKYAPEWTMVVSPDGLQGIKVRDVDTGKLSPVFSTTEPQVVKSNSRISGSASGLGIWHSGVYPMGGTLSFQAVAASRRAKGAGQMAADSGYDTNPNSNEHAGLYNFPLIGSFVTVHRTNQMEFVVESPIKIDIYDDHDWQRRQPVQSINLEFPQTGEAPPPELVRYSTEKRREETWVKPTVDACRWWTFNWGGAVHRWTGQGTFTAQGVTWGNNVRISNNTAGDDDSVRARGRLNGINGNTFYNNYDTVNGIPTGTGKANNIVTHGLVYGYMPVGQFNGVKSKPSDRANIDRYVPGGLRDMGEYGFFGSDTIRSILPKYGDYRIVAARKEVPGNLWMKHPLYDSSEAFMAHNFSSHWSSTEVGFYRGGTSDVSYDNKYALVPSQDYADSHIPDTPHTAASASASARYGDFDNGPGNSRDGAYINKPDEGNLSAIRMWWPTTNGNDRYLRNAYFLDQYMQMPARESYFTPNRMISSPGMLGSLPSGVFGSKPTGSNSGNASYLSDASVQGEAWRTLLFRAATPPESSAPNSLPRKAHPGGPSYAYGSDPADHYLMDLFWMPVVEPYAISDNWSTAGKVNMNFQIVPFTYIDRRTGVYGAMKGELITAIPSVDGHVHGSGKTGYSPTVNKSYPVSKRAGGTYNDTTETRHYKTWMDDTAKSGGSDWAPVYWSETSAKDPKYWHRYIDLDKSTEQMKARMDMSTQMVTGSHGLFRTASQICEIHLIPITISGASYNPTVTKGSPGAAASQMLTFWKNHGLTGDNTRERPYANLYQKLTTRSNTFRVYYRAQAMKKARSLAPNQVNTVTGTGGGADTIVAEYRGSALIERYLDLSGTTVPNYADGSDPMAKTSLEAYYRYRVLESKQFAP